MRKIYRLIIILSIFWISSCSYELSYQGELGKGVLPEGDQYAEHLSLAALETEGILYIQLPEEGVVKEEGVVHLQDSAGKILIYSLADIELMGFFMDETGEAVKGSEIFTTPDELLGVVNQDISARILLVRLYEPEGSLVFKTEISIPESSEKEKREKFYSLSITPSGDLVGLYGSNRGRPGGILRVVNFLEGNRQLEFIEKERFSNAMPLSLQAPFRFNAVLFFAGNYYITVDMGADPFDGVLILDENLAPQRYITGFWHYNCPLDVVIDDQGIIYTSSFYHDTLKAHDGEAFLAKTAPDNFAGYQNELMNNPAGMALAGNSIYVYDSDNGRINIFQTIGQKENQIPYSPTQLIIPKHLVPGSFSLNLTFIFYGVMIMISMNAFVFSFILKDRVFLYFGLFYLCGLFQMIDSIFDRFFFTLYHWNFFSPWPILFFLILFIERFIDLKVSMPRVEKIKRGVLAATLFFYFFSIIEGISGQKTLKTVLNISGDIFAVIFMLLLLIYLIFLTLRANRNAKTFLRFFLVLIIAGFLSPASVSKLFIPEDSTYYFSILYGNFPFMAGLLVSGFFLTYLLADRIINYRVSSAQMEEKSRYLEELDIKKTRYIMNISHELRTPLTLIQGLTRQIMKGKWGDSIQKNRSNFETIDRNTLKLQKQVNNFLELSRIEQNQREPQLKNIDMLSLLNQIAEEFQSLSDYLDVKLFLKVEKNCVLHADPYLFETALMNLISNAFKFTKTSGEIKLEGFSCKEGVIISVSDTGTGIREEDQTAIFSPFEQVRDDPYSSKGTGLGLSLVKEIMTLHKGQIKLESVFGSGSTFSLIFPSHSERDLPNWSIDMRSGWGLADEYGSELYGVDKIPTNQTLQKDRRSVLLVEDDPDMMRYLISEMTTHFSLTWAYNGKEALEVLTKMTPDLIISDIMMPEMDGWTLFEQLQEKISTKHIPFLFLTARNSQKEKLEALNKGIVDYLEKPFPSEEFIIRVKANIERGIVFKNRYKQQLKESLLDFVDNYDELHQNNNELSSFENDEIKEYDLSPRESEILQCITKGLSNKQIAFELGISVKTVGNHNSSIFKKMEVTSRLELLLLKNPSIGLI